MSRISQPVSGDVGLTVRDAGDSKIYHTSAQIAGNPWTTGRLSSLGCCLGNATGMLFIFDTADENETSCINGSVVSR